MEKKQFFYAFFFLFTLFFYLFLLDKNKRKYCTTDLYLTVTVHKLSIYQKKKTKHKEKK
jgi:hypothetical protein